MAGSSTRASVVLTLMPEPRASGTWFGMDSSASKIVSEQDHHAEGVLLFGTNCLRLDRPAARKRRVGIPRTASPIRKELEA